MGKKTLKNEGLSCNLATMILMIVWFLQSQITTNGLTKK